MRDRTDPDTLSQPLFSEHLLSSCSRHFFHLCHAQNAVTPLATPTTNTDQSSFKTHTCSVLCVFNAIAHHLVPLLCGILMDIYNAVIYALSSLLNCHSGDPLIGCSWPNSRPLRRFLVSISHLCIHLFLLLNSSNRYFFPEAFFYYHPREFAGCKTE